MRLVGVGRLLICALGERCAPARRLRRRFSRCARLDCCGGCGRYEPFFCGDDLFFW